MQRMESERLPAGRLFRSFLMIAGGYVAVLGVMFATLLLVLRFGYPASFELLTGQPMKEAEMLERMGEVLPTGLFWSVAAAGAVTAFCCGWMLVAWGGLPGTAHAIFLAIVLFVSGLQMAIGAPPPVRWMPWVLAGILPLAALLGAKLGLWGGDRPSPDSRFDSDK